MNNIDELDKQPLITNVMEALRSLEYDVQLRNAYMNKRDRYLFGDGLFEKLDIPDGFDKTMYNWCARVVDIQTAQFMGRPFAMYSQYRKEDLSVYSPQEKAQLEATKLHNKTNKTQADMRKNLIDQIIRDNGGHQLFTRGSRVGGAYGETVYKMWPEYDQKKVKITLLESPQNYRAGWSDSDFRERDYDSYVYQISVEKANKLYGKYLNTGEVWATSQEGFPLGQTIGNTQTSDPIDQTTNTTYPVQTQRKMVSVIDFTGTVRNWGLDGKMVKKVDPGKETALGIMIVGGKLVQLLTDEKKLPKYYPIRNKEVPRRAWGESDVSESALQINATFMERMTDYLTIANKTLFPWIQFKGFESASMPMKQQRKMMGVPMQLEQSIEAVNLPNNFGFEYEKILQELKEAFIRQTGISAVLFDSPGIDTASNTGLMTSMKNVTDVVEDKQHRWAPVLEQMFTDALHMTADMVPEAKQAIQTDDNWYLYIIWPEIMGKEDPAHQTMLLNDLHAGAISVATYMEKRGILDVSEEINRIRDDLADPVMGAIRANLQHELVQFAIYESMGLPAYGLNPPKVTLKGDLTPEQEGNLAQSQGYNDGPFGASIGPQGREGEAANDNFINQGEINGNPFDGGMPSRLPAGQAINPGQNGGAQPSAASPILTPSQNAPATQPVSQPGVAQPTTASAGGAVKAHNQRKGK